VASRLASVIPETRRRSPPETTGRGDYIIPFLAPGTYAVTYELQGFSTATQSTLVTAAGSVTLHVTLQVAGITEAVVVTGVVADAVVSGVPRSASYSMCRSPRTPTTSNAPTPV